MVVLQTAIQIELLKVVAVFPSTIATLFVTGRIFPTLIAYSQSLSVAPFLELVAISANHMV